MKKYMTIAALLAAGSAFANASYSFTTDASFYKESNGTNSCWVYVWVGTANTGNWSDGNSWDYLQSTTTEELVTVNNWTPGESNTAVLGYSYAWTNGNQEFAASEDELEITMSGKLAHGKLFLGSNVTLSGSVELGGNAGNAYTFNFGDFSGTSKIDLTSIDVSTANKEVKFSGILNMNGSTFSYTLLETDSITGTADWDASSVAVKDANGNELIYTEDSANKKAGYYWLETSRGSDGSFSVSLSAVAVPEPSAFGLLAGVGALALVASRRRRR